MKEMSDFTFDAYVGGRMHEVTVTDITDTGALTFTAESRAGTFQCAVTSSFIVICGAVFRQLQMISSASDERIPLAEPEDRFRNYEFLLMRVHDETAAGDIANALFEIDRRYPDALGKL